MSSYFHLIPLELLTQIIYFIDDEEEFLAFLEAFPQHPMLESFRQIGALQQQQYGNVRVLRVWPNLEISSTGRPVTLEHEMCDIIRANNVHFKELIFHQHVDGESIKACIQSCNSRIGLVMDDPRDSDFEGIFANNLSAISHLSSLKILGCSFSNVKLETLQNHFIQTVQDLHLDFINHDDDYDYYEDGMNEQRRQSIMHVMERATSSVHLTRIPSIMLKSILNYLNDQVKVLKLYECNVDLVSLQSLPLALKTLHLIQCNIVGSLPHSATLEEVIIEQDNSYMRLGEVAKSIRNLQSIRRLKLRNFKARNEQEEQNLIGALETTRIKQLSLSKIATVSQHNFLPLIEETCRKIGTLTFTWHSD